MEGHDIYELANRMDADFQKEVKADFEKMIADQLDTCPMFPDILPDIIYKWRSRWTRKTYQLARHSFKTGKTVYRFFDEKAKAMQQEERMRIHISVTEIQIKRSLQLWYAKKIGFDIEYKDYKRFYLL